MSVLPPENAAAPTPPENVETVHPGELVVALAGNPNVGKTTLFNALTGLKQKVANYPGVTVEKKVGRLSLGKGSKQECQLIDLPGTYSLASRSPDEHVARRVVLGQIAGTPRPDVIVVVADASNLERNLYLVTQVLELGRPVVVALTMMDIAEKQGKRVEIEKLRGHLRAPVIAVEAHKGGGGKGIEELRTEIAKAGKRGAVDPLALQLPDIMETHIERLRKILVEEELCGEEQANFDAHLIISTGDDEDTTDAPDTRLKHPKVRQEILAAMADFTTADVDPIAAEVETHYTFIGSVIHDCVREPEAAKNKIITRTDRIDRIVTHKLWGMLIFVAIMGLVFWTIFSFAQPIMDFLQNNVIGGLGTWIGNHMSDGPLRDLTTDGIIAGVGTVMSFLPQIALLFLFLAILEDSGYMSRAAFLMDRLMSRVGLHGKSFIPLLSGFACAVPAIMGTRVIENRRDRLATILILPLMSCSARLPIYTLLIGLLFSKEATGYSAHASVAISAIIMLSMYLLGTFSAFGLAWIFKRTLLKGPAPAFIMEMPPYRLPHWKVVLTTVTQRCWAFLKRAGTVIFAFSVIMWAATHYPKPKTYSRDYAAAKAPLLDQQSTLKKQLPDDVQTLATSDDPKDAKKIPANLQEPAKQFADVSDQLDDLDNAQSQEVLEQSAAGRVGKAIAPIFYPLGYDWKGSVGVAGAFFAREVIVSTMGIVYSVGKSEDSTDALQKAMKDDRWPAGTSRAGKPIWTPLSGISMMVFVVFCMQCLSTLAITKRETGHWGWSAFMFVYMTGLAWIMAFAVYQIGSLMGF